jgi:flagellar hook-associated protein 1 FlgK
MSNLFDITTSALQAFQTAIAVTSNNIANANTPGYADESINLSNAVPQTAGETSIGAGVVVTSVSRAYSQLAETQLNTSQGTLGQLNGLQTYTNQVDNIVGTTAGGITTALQNYYNAWSTVADDPTSTAARQALIGSAQSVAQGITNTAGQLQNLNTAINNGITGDVAQINSYAQSIATLNSQIAIGTAQGSGQAPNDLIDQRDSVISNLSKLVGVSTTTDASGAVNVFIGSGQPLVLQGNVTQLTTQPNQFNASQLEVSTTADGGNYISSSLTSGDLGGLFAARSQAVNPTLNQLGLLASGLAQSANTQQASGFTLSGAVGSALFTAAGPTATVSRNNTDTTTVTALVGPLGVAGLSPDNLVLSYKNGAYSLTDQTTGAAVPFTQGGTAASPTFSANGLSITLSAKTLSGAAATAPAAGDEFLIQPTSPAASNISVALTDPSQIAAAGLETAANTANTGTGTISAATVATPAALTTSPTTITFSTPPTTYSISGNTTSYTYSSGSTIYSSGSPTAANAWTVAITGTPAAGDTFTVSPGASGNAVNATAAADQQTEGVLSGGTISISGGANDLITSVGSQAQQVNTAQTAQSDVNTQALQSVQSISGVNLDDEAANLLQWQQAYQASAQAFSIGNAVFTSLLAAVNAT